MNEVFKQNYGSEEPINIDHLLIYMSKGDKFFVLADSKGFFYTFKRDGTLLSRFYSGFKKISSIGKHYVNIFFTSENKIGFIKLSESKVGSIICDGGSY